MASHTQGIRGNLNTLNASKTTHPSPSTHSRHSSHHHPRHVQGIQGTPQHIQGIQGTHDFVVLNRQQNVHGVWATATFRQKSSRRVDHSNISPLQDPARRGQILRSGRRPDPVGVSINRTIISEGFFGPGEPRSHLGRFRNPPGEARNGTFLGGPRDRNFDRRVRTRERRRHTKRDEKNHDTEDIIFEDAPESKKYQPTSGHLKIELPSRMRWAPRASRRRRRSRA